MRPGSLFLSPLNSSDVDSIVIHHRLIKMEQIKLILIRTQICGFLRMLSTDGGGARKIKRFNLFAISICCQHSSILCNFFVGRIVELSTRSSDNVLPSPFIRRCSIRKCHFHRLMSNKLIFRIMAHHQWWCKPIKITFTVEAFIIVLMSTTED